MGLAERGRSFMGRTEPATAVPWGGKEEAGRRALDVTISHVRDTVLARLGQHSAMSLLGLRGGPGARRVGSATQPKMSHAWGVSQQQPASQATPQMSFSVPHSSATTIQRPRSAVSWAKARGAQYSNGLDAPCGPQLPLRPGSARPYAPDSATAAPTQRQLSYSHERARAGGLLDLGKLGGVVRSPLDGKLAGGLRSRLHSSSVGRGGGMAGTAAR